MSILKEALGLMNDYAGDARKRVSKLEANDLLEYIGLQQRRTAMDYILPALGLFAAGIAVGATVGMMVAPKAGTDLREGIRENVRQKVSDLRERVQGAGAAVPANGGAPSLPRQRAPSR
jgi:hypothetical protein